MPEVTVDPGGEFAVIRSIVRVRGTGVAPGVWRCGLFVNDVQETYITFTNKEFVTYEMPLVEIQRGDHVDVRLYYVNNEASAPAQICDWRVENMCHVGCNPYAGGNLEGFFTTDAEVPCDGCAAAEESQSFIDELAAGGDFVDPLAWAASDDLAPAETPPWESLSDPWDPGPGEDLLFVPFAPAV